MEVETVDVTGEIEQFIQSELLAGKGKRTVGADENLIKLGVIDSFGLMELIGFLEERYGIQVDDEDIVPDNFETVTSIQAFLDGKRRLPSQSA